MVSYHPGLDVHDGSTTLEENGCFLAELKPIALMPGAVEPGESENDWEGHSYLSDRAKL
jgi:hypothetical protein